MAKETTVADVNILSDEKTRKLFGKQYANEDGTNELDKPAVLKYVSYFHKVTWMYDATIEDLVVCATIPDMTLMIDGSDKRKGMMSGKVKEAELPIISSQGNTHFYALESLFTVLSAVGTRGGTGLASFKAVERKVMFTAIQEQLATIAGMLGEGTDEFDTLFVDGKAVDLEIVLQSYYEVAKVKYDVERAEKKAARDAAKLVDVVDENEDEDDD